VSSSRATQVPGLIAYVLFVLVPRYGLDNERLNVAFGFLWSRFEAPIYFWEVIVRLAVSRPRHVCDAGSSSRLRFRFSLAQDMVRKIGLVVILLLVDDPLVQSMLGAVCVGFVMVLNFKYAPFIRDAYDILDSAGCIVEVLVYLLGICVLYSDGETEVAILSAVFLLCTTARIRTL
jgi:hypothetical protein